MAIRSSFKQATVELVEYLKDNPSTIGINQPSFRVWQFHFRQHNIRDFYEYRDGRPIMEGLFIIDYGTRRTLDYEIIWRSQKITLKKLFAMLEDTPPIVNLSYLRGGDFLDRAFRPDFEYNKTLEYLKIYDLRKLK